MIYDTENPTTLKVHIARQEREIVDLEYQRDQLDDALRTARGIVVGLGCGLALWIVIALVSCS